MDDQSTLWKADQHTIAKHRILSSYLDRWMPILTRQYSGNLDAIRYVDGFAGPGEYVNHEPGSPQVAIRSAIQHKHNFPIPIKMLFIEDRHDRYEHLLTIISNLQSSIDASANIMVVPPYEGDCEGKIRSILDSYDEKNKRFGPAMIFLDQFGYSAVSMDLMGRILRNRSCEVFSFLNWRDLNRYITDPNKEPGITRAFGSDEWKSVITMSPRDRENTLLNLYIDALKEKAGARYQCHFSMYDHNDCLLYWLFFCTGSIRGLEEMKKAMWIVDTSGEFCFSDKFAGQPKLLNGYDQQWLAGELTKHLSGRNITIGDLHEWVLVNTPCYLFKKALAALEKQGGILVANAPSGRRQGTFSKDDIMLAFATP